MNTPNSEIKTPTPRTDELVAKVCDPSIYSSLGTICELSNFSRQLEQELQQAREENTKLREEVERWRNLAKSLDAEIESDGYRAQDKQIKDLQSQLTQAQGEVYTLKQDLEWHRSTLKNRDETVRKEGEAWVKAKEETDTVKAQLSQAWEELEKFVQATAELEIHNLVLRNALTKLQNVCWTDDWDADEVKLEINKALSLTSATSTNYIPREEYERVVRALRMLHDWQNGCPLPSYEKGWGEAMRLTQEVLPLAEQLLKGGQ